MGTITHTLILCQFPPPLPIVSIMIGYNIYNQAFRASKWGYASALSWLLLIFVGIVTGIMFWLRSRIMKED